MYFSCIKKILKWNLLKKNKRAQRILQFFYMEDKNLSAWGLENQFEKIRVDLLSIHMYGIANQIRFLTLSTCE